MCIRDRCVMALMVGAFYGAATLNARRATQEQRALLEDVYKRQTLSCAGALLAPFSLTGVVSLFAGVCPPSGVEFCEDSSSTRLSVAGVDALPPAGSFSGGSSSAGVCFGAVAVGVEVETAVASGVSSA